jgi:putative inorganic carbon (hco3(-)) transporter
MIAGAPAPSPRLSFIVLGAVCVAFGLVAGALPNPLLAAGALCGIAFLLVALVAPVIALTGFVALTFISQLSGVGASVSVAKGAGAALVLAWLYHEGIGERRFAARATVRMFAAFAGAFVVLGIMSALWAADPHTALSDTFRLAQGPLLVIVVASIVRTPKDLMTVCIAFVIGAAVSAAAGMGGLTHPDQTLASTGRLSGGVTDPNYLAAVLVPGIILSLFLALTLESTRSRLLVGLCGLISTVGLFLTQSRGGVIALAVAAVGAIAIAGRLRRQIVVVLLVIAAFASMYLFLVAPPQSLSRITSFTAAGASGTGRTDLWTVAAKTFERHPFFGVGAGNFTVVEQRYAVGLNRDLPRADLVVQAHEQVHNTYLHVASELGAVGLGLFLVTLGIAFRACRRAIVQTRRADVSALSRALFVGCFGMLVAFVFLTAQYQKQLWLVIALLLAAGGTATAERELLPVSSERLRRRASLQR